MVGSNKEAVKIDDWVSDIRGSFVGWVDATDETPPDFNGEAFRLVYSPHVATNKSWIFKVGSVLARLAFEGFGSTRFLEVSNAVYPKSAIEGFEGGTTVSGVPHDKGTPDKRVVLKNDVEGNRPYMREVGPGNDGDDKTKSELQDRINELEMELKAEESKNAELSEDVDREDEKGSSRYGPEYYDGVRPNRMDDGVNY